MHFLSLDRILLSCYALILLLGNSSGFADEPAAMTTIDFGRYQHCPVLSNQETRVVLCPQLGGRVLEYSLGGKNAIFVSNFDMAVDEPTEAWKWDPSGGRFDIGPEMIVPKRDVLFRGIWQSELVAPLHIRLTSEDCPNTGVRLERDFQLSSRDSQLIVTQRIINVSDQTVRYCHWSRTLAKGAGIVLVPLSPTRRFPNGYVRYDSGLINTKPVDTNVRVRDGFVELLGPPLSPKLGMDSMRGWLAHQQTSGLLFIKKFPTHPDRAYAEVAALTISTWTAPRGEAVELEPIGPTEVIAPGESASFTERWWLLDGKFPAEGESIDLAELTQRVEALPSP